MDIATKHTELDLDTIAGTVKEWTPYEDRLGQRCHAGKFIHGSEVLIIVRWDPHSDATTPPMWITEPGVWALATKPVYRRVPDTSDTLGCAGGSVTERHLAPSERV